MKNMLEVVGKITELTVQRDTLRSENATLRARIAELEGAIKRVQSHADYGSVAFKIADEALRGGK